MRENCQDPLAFVWAQPRQAKAVPQNTLPWSLQAGRKHVGIGEEEAPTIVANVESQPGFCPNAEPQSREACHAEMDADGEQNANSNAG